MPDQDPQGLLSLLRDSTARASLEQYMLKHGVDQRTASEAANRCSQAALKNGVVGAVTGALLTLWATSPVAGIGAPAGAVLGLVLGSGGTLVFSEQCQQVRDAAFKIAQARDSGDPDVP
jgi:hypothetical protein